MTGTATAPHLTFELICKTLLYQVRWTMIDPHAADVSEIPGRISDCPAACAIRATI